MVVVDDGIGGTESVTVVDVLGVQLDELLLPHTSFGLVAQAVRTHFRGRPSEV
jgi:hypothetical protein